MSRRAAATAAAAAAEAAAAEVDDTDMYAAFMSGDGDSPPPFLPPKEGM